MLSEPVTNTRSANPATDRIGVMPDLKAIYDALRIGRSAPGDYPLPNRSDVAYAGRGRGVSPARVACIDPGHGGRADRGRSTAYGARGSRHTLEKEVNLRLGRAIRRYLGTGVVLTRDGDYNLSLAERTALARQSGAPVFVSVHNNASQTARRGAEVWVYGNDALGAGEPSRALARVLCEELGRLGHSASVQTGELAVLHPSHHVRGAAACLIEADYLSHPDGEARLCDASQLDALAGAVACGVRRYLDRAAARRG